MKLRVLLGLVPVPVAFVAVIALAAWRSAGTGEPPEAPSFSPLEVDHSENQGSAEEILEYWTEERMRNAQPMPMPTLQLPDDAPGE